MTTTAAQNVIQSGWKTARITEALQVGVKGLGSLDPFQEIDPLIDENSAIFNAREADIEVLKSKYSVDSQMIVILEAIPNEKMEIKLILNGTHLML